MTCDRSRAWALRVDPGQLPRFPVQVPHGRELQTSWPRPAMVAAASGIKLWCNLNEHVLTLHNARAAHTLRS